MKHKDTRINIGGMLRCCIQTLNEMDLESDVYDGQVVDCFYEPSGNKALILSGNTWMWNEKGRHKNDAKG